MLRRFRQHARITASAAGAAVAMMLFVTCVSAANMTPEEKVCCASMQHNCGDMAVQSSCCVGQVQEERSLAATKPSVGLVPVAALIAVLTTTPAPISFERQPWLAEKSSPKPPGVPTYLFVSSFRI